MLQAALYPPLQINPALCLWHHRLRHHRRQTDAPAANRNRSQHRPKGHCGAMLLDLGEQVSTRAVADLPVHHGLQHPAAHNAAPR
jgi:hypothetical protein